MAHTIRGFLGRLQNFASYVQRQYRPSRAKRRLARAFRARHRRSRAVLLRLRRLPPQAKKRLAVTSIFLVAFIVVILSLRDIVDFAVRPIVDLAVGKMYENVVAPNDTEMPVTVTSYPSASHVVSIIGGRGEGLNCSLPSGIDYLFEQPRSASSQYSPVRQRFRQACVFHDLCYRHGLATYGYSQSDCDQMLQEHAFRICMYASPHDGRSLRKCQLDAKKILAGVTFGGFKWYQKWSTSTYFEFDSSPSRSELYSAARVIDHPFKGADPKASQHESDQLLLSFEIKRSGVTVACRNCPQRKFTPAELESAALLLSNGTPNPQLGMPTPPPPEAIIQVAGGPLPPSQPPPRLPTELDRLELDQERVVWLPLGGINSAPHLISVRHDHQRLVWLNRESTQNTVSCLVIADPKNLLTHTRPGEAECKQTANSWLKLDSVDFFASSPQPMILTLPSAEGKQDTRVVAVGLTTQAEWSAPSPSSINRIVGPLKVCLSGKMNESASRSRMEHCFKLRSGHEPIVNELGAFQNFPIVKGERQIYLSRKVLKDPTKNDSDAIGRALIFDVDHRQIGGAFKGPVKLVHNRQFSIPDDFDPMMPMTRDKNDLRLLSVRSSLGKIGIHEIDFKVDMPTPVLVPIAWRSGAENIELDKSWARRPVLVVDSDPMSPGQSKTQLFFSRSTITTAEKRDDEDSVRFEFLVLERSLEKDKPILRYARGLNCKITYSFEMPHSLMPCRRSSEMAGQTHRSPAQTLQGAQLLVGRFKTRKETGATPKELRVALPDACFPRDPIILDPIGGNEWSGPMSFEPIKLAEAKNGTRQGEVERRVECGPLADQKQIADKM